MQNFKVPFAIDEFNRVVSPKEADRDKKYFCPSCKEELILRRGKVKKAHFAHKSNNCSQESVIHKLAKLLIIQKIATWKSGKAPSPIIQRKCPKCGTIKEQKLPDKVEKAIEEKRLKNGFIVDVGIISNGDIVAAIEVKVTHGVDENKIKNIDIPFIEVIGEEIIENPMIWRPITDKFKTFKCKNCNLALKQYFDKLQTISIKTGIKIPNSFYRTSYYKCWKCEKEILVFAWPKNLSHKLAKDKQKPKTIQYRYSKMAREKYWANTCPYCNALQGDFFLFSEPDSPLFGFECGEDTKEDFEEDILKLALNIRENFYY